MSVHNLGDTCHALIKSEAGECYGRINMLTDEDFVVVFGQDNMFLQSLTHFKQFNYSKPFLIPEIGSISIQAGDYFMKGFEERWVSLQFTIIDTKDHQEMIQIGV